MVSERLKQDLINLGIREDDTILMHSSLSSLGYVDGGAETVIDTLLDLLKNGTLLVPSLSYKYSSESKQFSVTETPSCVGTISEYFRQRPDVIRSMHPTHSVCGKGKNAEEILSQHIETDTPAGAKSACGLLPKYDGKILRLGCSLRPNTSMHAVEEVTKPWYAFKNSPETFTLVDAEGERITKDYICHDFSMVWQRYDRLAELMEIPTGKVLEANCYLIPAKKMWEVAVEKMRADENYFIDLR